jgi:succinate dehydrogenase/fumarate reductase flavoprotein subunit
VSHYGATGLALEAGASGKNLTEWQYGLASTRPRWNVSGTYMQVLPRVYSAEADGSDEREFLMDFFTEPAEMLSKLFLKGYQWPFDVRKVASGSSIIDILVYLESCKGRKVYLDYRTNPVGGNFRFEELEPEARDYLTRAGACFGTPIERLLHMNTPAVEFYRDKGVDLATEPLEIALCAQHNNGGLGIDCWWQTDLEGLFSAGEAAASHGVYRPGGSALNAGQVGSTRAAQYIAARCQGEPEGEETFRQLAQEALQTMSDLAKRTLSDSSNVRRIWDQTGQRMSQCGAAIRNSQQIEEALAQISQQLDSLADTVTASREGELQWVFRLRDTLISQKVYLSAMLDYVAQGGKSRGSALYTDPAGTKPFAQLPDAFIFCLDDGSRGNLVQEVKLVDGQCQFHWRPVRPIPEDDDFFENVWRAFRETGNFD